jgi:hypothetical protein
MSNSNQISTTTLAQNPAISSEALGGVQGGSLPGIGIDHGYKVGNGMSGNSTPESKRTFFGDLNQARKNIFEKPAGRNDEVLRSKMAQVLTAVQK